MEAGVLHGPEAETVPEAETIPEAERAAEDVIIPEAETVIEAERAAEDEIIPEAETAAILEDIQETEKIIHGLRAETDIKIEIEEIIQETDIQDLHEVSPETETGPERGADIHLILETTGQETDIHRGQETTTTADILPAEVIQETGSRDQDPEIGIIRDSSLPEIEEIIHVLRVETDIRIETGETDLFPEIRDSLQTGAEVAVLDLVVRAQAFLEMLQHLSLERDLEAERDLRRQESFIQR